MNTSTPLTVRNKLIAHKPRRVYSAQKDENLIMSDEESEYIIQPCVRLSTQPSQMHMEDTDTYHQQNLTPTFDIGRKDISSGVSERDSVKRSSNIEWIELENEINKIVNPDLLLYKNEQKEYKNEQWLTILDIPSIKRPSLSRLNFFFSLLKREFRLIFNGSDPRDQPHGLKTVESHIYNFIQKKESDMLNNYIDDTGHTEPIKIDRIWSNYEVPLPVAWHPSQLGKIAVGAYNSRSVVLTTSKMLENHPKTLSRSRIQPDYRSTIRSSIQQEENLYKDVPSNCILLTEKGSCSGCVTCIAFRNVFVGCTMAIGTNGCFTIIPCKETVVVFLASNGVIIVSYKTIEPLNNQETRLKLVAENDKENNPLFAKEPLFFHTIGREIVEIHPFVNADCPVTALLFFNDGHRLLVALGDGSVYLLQREYRQCEYLPVWSIVREIKLSLSYPKQQRSVFYIDNADIRFIVAMSLSTTLPTVALLSNGGDIVLLDIIHWQYRRLKVPLRKMDGKLHWKIQSFPAHSNYGSFLIGTTRQLWEVRLPVQPIRDRKTGNLQQDVAIHPIKFEIPSHVALADSTVPDILDFSLDPVDGNQVFILFDNYSSVIIYKLLTTSPLDPITTKFNGSVIVTNSRNLQPLAISVAPSAPPRDNISPDITPKLRSLSQARKFENMKEKRKLDRYLAVVGKVGNDYVYLMKTYKSSPLDSLSDLKSELSQTEKIAKQEVRVFQIDVST